MKKGIFYTIFTLLLIFSMVILIEVQQQTSLKSAQQFSNYASFLDAQHVKQDIKQTFLKFHNIDSITVLETDNYTRFSINGSIEDTNKTAYLTALQSIYTNTLNNKLGGTVSFSRTFTTMFIRPYGTFIAMGNNLFRIRQGDANNITIHVSINAAINNTQDQFSDDGGSHLTITVNITDNTSAQYGFIKQLNPAQTNEYFVFNYTTGIINITFGNDLGSAGILDLSDSGGAQMNITSMQFNFTKSGPTQRAQVIGQGEVIQRSSRYSIREAIELAQT